MKKQLKLISFGIIILCLNLKLHSQSSINGIGPGHAAGAGPVFTFWCGWDPLTTIPFNPLARI